MIVDDEPISQNYIRGLISWEEEGFSLYPPVYSGEEAREILASSPVDIVFLDVFMPGENGVVLSHYIVDHYPQIAIVAISSHDDYDYVREILKKGAYDYILKHRLNAETIRIALNGITARMKGSPVSAAEELHKRIRAWLFSGASFPFPAADTIIGVSAAKVSLEALPGSSREIIISGIISLLENDIPENDPVLNTVGIDIFYREPDFLILCARFSGDTPQKQVSDFLISRNQKNREKIKGVFNLEYYYKTLPFLDPAAIPSQIRRLLDSFPDSGNPSRNMGITLSVNNRKILTYLLKENNRAGTELILRSIFGTIDKMDQGAVLAVIKDVGAIFSDYTETEDISAQLEDLYRNAGDRLRQIADNNPVNYLVSFFCQFIGGKADESADAYIRQAHNFMLNHYTENPGLEKTAAALNISPSYLSRLYKRTTGCSFVEALNQIRVEASKACLLEGMNLKSTAAICGFMYYNYFIKVFRDHTGITPSEFIRQGI